jgi:hypothetical protein
MKYTTQELLNLLGVSQRTWSRWLSKEELINKHGYSLKSVTKENNKVIYDIEDVYDVSYITNVNLPKQTICSIVAELVWRKGKDSYQRDEQIAIKYGTATKTVKKIKKDFMKANYLGYKVKGANGINLSFDESQDIVFKYKSGILKDSNNPIKKTFFAVKGGTVYDVTKSQVRKYFNEHENDFDFIISGAIDFTFNYTGLENDLVGLGVLQAFQQLGEERTDEIIHEQLAEGTSTKLEFGLK